MNSREHTKHLRQYAFTESMGYVEKLEWLEKMSSKYNQVRCSTCGLYVIFKKKGPISEQKTSDR